jgi:hypothetical protein
VPALHCVRSGSYIDLIGELVRMANDHVQSWQIRQRAGAIGQRVSTGLHEGRA